MNVSKHSFYSHLFNFIISCIQNFTCACYISGIICLTSPATESDWNFPVLFFGFVLTLALGSVHKSIGCRFCNQIFDFDGNIDLLEAVYTPDYYGESFENFKTLAHSQPPRIQIKTQWNQDTYIRRYGSRKRAVRTDLMSLDYYIPYTSWKAESTPNDVQIDGNTQKPLIVFLDNKFNLTLYIQMLVNEHGCSSNFSNVRKLHFLAGYLQPITVFPGNSCVIEQCQSKFGSVVYFISHFFGFEALIFNLTGLFLRRITIHTERSLSDINEYPIPAYHSDPKYSSTEMKDQNYLEFPMNFAEEHENEPEHMRLGVYSSPLIEISNY